MPRKYLLIFALSFTLLMTQAGQALALEVTGLRLGPHPDKTRLVLELSAPTDFRSFILTDPTRLVIDMPSFRWHVGKIGKPAGARVSNIRQGALQPGISRIVIDLTQQALIQDAFLIPRKNGLPDRLVIDFAPASPENFAKKRNIVFGTLDTGIPQTATQAQITEVTANIPVPPPTPRKPVVSRQNRPLIVIDAGHGGEDPGALGGHGLKEKNITLAMARDLKKSLEETGRYRVSLTRDKDVFIRLSQRVKIARDRNADLFISLHADSINRSGVSGASIYTLSEKASDAETEKLATRENHADMIAGVDLSHEDEDVANILVDLAMRDTMNQSKFFAGNTVTRLKQNGVRVLDNPHRFAGFAVLKAPDIPSVLIELGYMSNDKESLRLSQPDYRNKIARALVDSIDLYFDTVSR